MHAASPLRTRIGFPDIIDPAHFSGDTARFGFALPVPRTRAVLNQSVGQDDLQLLRLCVRDT